MEKNRKSVILAMAASVVLAMSGCAGATGNTNAKYPVERGLSYVAAAIVTSGVLRAIFNE